MFSTVHYMICFKDTVYYFLRWAVQKIGKCFKSYLSH